MRIGHIIDKKGSSVITIPSEKSLSECARTLVTEGVGALVVADGTGAPMGLISERDIVSSVAAHGAPALELKANTFSDPKLYTCHPDDDVDWVSRLMTQRRLRHVPVVDDGVLCGIISVGDVLKHKLEESKLELGVMRDVAIARAH